MNFGQAIDAMKHGEKVQRKIWNARGMFLWLMPEANVKTEWCKEPVLKKLAEDNGGEIHCLGTIRMFTEQKTVLTGWLASQSDMLAEDWDIYAPPKTIEQLAKENIEFCERELNKRGYELIR